MLSDLKVGDRVMLSADTIYYTSNDNPAIGSEWECEGVVTKNDGGWVHVDWDNGYHNTYTQDLILLDNFTEVMI